MSNRTNNLSFLAVENLSVEFKTRNGRVKAISDVSFTLSKGEVVGIVGESGSGKSVTAYTLMRLLDQAGAPTDGNARFDGISLLDISEPEMRELRGREVSMIFQNPRAALNPIRPVGKQIEDVLIKHVRASRSNARAKAIEMLDKVKILDPESRYWSYPFELSGGMCQRVMIAIAVACDPRLIIADEPTTGLDVTTQKITMDLIQDLTRSRGMSAILITHDLGLAAQYCDRIIVMQDGKIVEQAPVRELFNSPSHPYTQKLIAASPGPYSELADLTRIASTKNTPPSKEGISKSAHRTRSDFLKHESLLSVRNLVKVFKKSGAKGTRWLGSNTGDESLFRAVNNISFDLKQGESLGLVGESGCGKSTTSSMITRLIDPTSGQIIFDGEDLTEFPAKEFSRLPQRMKIQMVFQDAHDSLNPRYTARDAIAEPLIRLQKLKDKQKLDARISELAEQVGLPKHLLSRFPHQLSGGQKARVGIARAISVNPKLLILDEPTSALDVSVQAVVLQLLDNLRRELGMSYIFVSHDLNVVRLLCERVIVMNKGQIVETGISDEVLRNPKNSYTCELISAIPHFEPARL